MRASFLLVVLAASAFAQAPSSEIAHLREDLRLLNQRVGELTLRVEQLERENEALRRNTEAANPQNATLAQLNDGIADLHKAIKVAVQSGKTEIMQQVDAKLEKLATQTNAVLDSLQRGQTAQSGSGSFSDNFPKEGISYTVQKGDTLAKIAQKTGAKREDIINANKLSDPSKIQIGQVLFIPLAK